MANFPALVFASGFALTALSAFASCRGRADPRADQGKALFEGKAPLVGRIAAEDDPLSVAAVRCSNCHAHAAGGGGDSALDDYGPVLSRQTLTSTRPRRGGPPSRYDEASFCKLLATGIDPAYVMIARAMPRYTLDAASCQALWVFLASGGDS